jgi:ABC-type lipoprotein export system ATPase subunit
MWHRWDPHLHAPGTLLSDQFRGDWEAYLSSIEKSEPRVRALGVTDYFCIQTYKEVRKRKAAGRLPEVALLFPNVEMRLDIKTAKTKPINLHLLFSPEDPKHEYEIERILGQLRFKYQDRGYACNRLELIRLGQAFDPNQSDDDGAFRTGASQFKTTLSDLQDLFSQEKKWLSKNCLVAVASKSADGTSGLQEDSSFTALRQELERFADIIFSGSPKQRAFWLGKHPDYPPAKIEDTYGTLKPCMHGSDAHRIEAVGAPALDRYCWIKGDLAFETLRQAVIEPEDRVWIGDSPPPGPMPSETLEEIDVENAPWLATRSLHLNPGLITIIGARGSGKTALMEFLAAGANALTPTPSESSFLNRAGDLLEDATVTLKWKEGGKENTVPLRSSNEWLEYEAQEAEVCYLSQQFVERLCSSAGLATELRQEMERVVFEATPQDDRYNCKSFQELATLSLDHSRVTRMELQESIMNIGEAVLKEENLRDQLPTLNTAIQSATNQISNIQKQLKDLLPKDKESHVRKLTELENFCSTKELQVQELKRRRKYLTDLQTDVKQTLGLREPSRLQDLKSRFLGAGLTEEEWKAFQMVFAGDVNQILRGAILKIDTLIERATSGDPAKPLTTTRVAPESLPLNDLRALRDAVKKEVGIDVDRQKRYEALQRTMTQLNTTLRKTEEEHAVAKGAPDRRSELLSRRRNEYAEVFKTFVEEEETLASLYKSLRERLKEARGAISKLAFVVQREVDLDAWVERGEGLLDLRQASAFRGRGALRTQAERRILRPWTRGGPEDVAEAMEQFRRDLYEDLQRALPEFHDAHEKRARMQEIAAWLYDTTHITIQYGITYEGIPIERLSPGTRGIVLLLLYLVIDTHDRRPLFIDQPEENLDPRSVYTELVPHFRKAKQRRQIVMVTHNANLVVNTDADQVIVAASQREHDGGLPTMTYTTGGIENPMIRSAICRLLEGGRRAFLEREKRYRIYSGDPNTDSEGEESDAGGMAARA